MGRKYQRIGVEAVRIMKKKRKENQSNVVLSRRFVVQATVA